MRAKALVVFGLAILIPFTIQAQSDKQTGDSHSPGSQSTASQSASSQSANDAGESKPVSAEGTSAVGEAYDPYPQIYDSATVASIVEPAPTQPAKAPNPSPASAAVTYTRTSPAQNSLSASGGVTYSRTAPAPTSYTASAGVTYSRTAAAPTSYAASGGVTYSRTTAAPTSSPASAGVTYSRTVAAASSSPVGLAYRFHPGYIAEGYSADPSVTRDGHGKIQPSAAAKEAFQKQQPCPSTGKVDGACPGHVIQHVRPLECGGADAPSNMQWQTAGNAKDAAQLYCR